MFIQYLTRRSKDQPTQLNTQQKVRVWLLDSINYKILYYSINTYTYNVGTQHRTNFVISKIANTTLDGQWISESLILQLK